jgi:DNA helicase-2/ATP-dependent DNA helicase PcrA
MSDLPETQSEDLRYPYLAALNEAQREAVSALDGPVLVLAGAGTGKTRVLTTRLAHLLFTGRAHPGQVLAVTFTNKAAREMKDRVAMLLSRPVEGWWLGTFHAMAARILRTHAERIGLRPDFTILDTDDQLRLVKQVLEAENVDDKEWPARKVQTAIQRWKDRGLICITLTAAPITSAGRFSPLGPRGISHSHFRHGTRRFARPNR